MGERKEGKKGGKERERQRERKIEAKRHRGIKKGWQEGVRDSEGAADTETSAGHLEAQDRRKQAAETKERERRREGES